MIRYTIGMVLALGMLPLHWLPVPEIFKIGFLVVQAFGLGLQIGAAGRD